MIKAKSVEYEGVTIWVATCPYCGKETTSIYQKQAETNMEFHILFCKKKEKEDGN